MHFGIKLMEAASSEKSRFSTWAWASAHGVYATRTI